MKMFAILSVLLLSACGQIKGEKGDPGTSGSSGSNGEQGQSGATGATGAPGLAGTSGRSITPVKLCDGFTPSYPSSFPEYALCLQNQLYGVYSANGGFLALLPPGQYRSEGINATCTFTVAAGCEVSE